MNAIAKINPSGALVSAEQAEAVRTALKSSLYPGASDASVDMVLAYCRATGLDPMTKPVHIVPMKVNTGRKDDRGWDIKETRDVVMPGIGLYRINAARTGQYAGCSEPEFGPTRQLQFKREQWEDKPHGSGRQKRLVDAELIYPEWCKVTVTRVVDGKEREFTAKEYWLENFAEKGEGGGPNPMWEKRPFAQLAKCTEAQALRKAFPEAVGSQPTADEMEGKDIIEGTATQVPAARQVTQELPFYSAADFDANLPKWWSLIASGRKTADEVIATVQTKGRLTAEQIKEIRNPPKDEADPEDEPQQPPHGEDA